MTKLDMILAIQTGILACINGETKNPYVGTCCNEHDEYRQEKVDLWEKGWWETHKLICSVM